MSGLEFDFGTSPHGLSASFTWRIRKHSAQGNPLSAKLLLTVPEVYTSPAVLKAVMFDRLKGVQA